MAHHPFNRGERLSTMAKRTLRDREERMVKAEYEPGIQESLGLEGDIVTMHPAECNGTGFVCRTLKEIAKDQGWTPGPWHDID